MAHSKKVLHTSEYIPRLLTLQTVLDLNKEYKSFDSNPTRMKCLHSGND